VDTLRIACEEFEKYEKQQEQKEQNRFLRQQEIDTKREQEKFIKKEQQRIQDNLISKFGYDVYKYKFKSNLSKEELGKRYERYIGYLYENDGYRVDYHGILKGKKDGGIDIIAMKKKEVFIIQCKRYGKDTFVHENTINQLYGALTYQKEKYQNKNVRAILYTANNNIDDEALEKLEHFKIEHIVKQHPKNENYPLIKCNTGKDDSKIYHVPDYGMYDRIKIELHKGEFYCETPNEAELKGFRKTK
jgi:Holliday junction resolvase